MMMKNQRNNNRAELHVNTSIYKRLGNDFGPWFRTAAMERGVGTIAVLDVNS